MLETLKRAGLGLGATAGLMVLGVMMAGSASAAGDPVEDAFTDMGLKVTLYGGLIVGLVVLSAAIFLGIKYLRKGVSKA